MRAAIALGSNLASRFGGPAANLEEAVHRLGDLGDVVALSRFYRTKPVGYLNQPWFLNAAALLRTDLGPVPLLHALLEVERGMGRLRSLDAPPKGPRILDLDLLLYEEQAGKSLVLQDPALVLPHPAMRQRRFVLEPLAEIAPGMRVPPDNQSVESLLDHLNGA